MLCHCGCGKTTNIAKITNNSRGTKKGDYQKFLPGHSPKRDTYFPHFCFYLRDRGFKSECWESKPTRDGYATVKVNGKNLGAHRVLFENLYGPVPADLQIDHLCRNRSCVRPDHMEAVIRAVNVRRGLSTKLTANQVTEIRALYSAGRSQQSIADEYGVNQTMIGFIVRRVSWKDV